MTLTDGFIALGVLIAIGYVLLKQASDKNPKLKRWMENINPKKKKIEQFSHMNIENKMKLEEGII